MNYEQLALGSAAASALLLAGVAWLGWRVWKLDRIRREFFLTDGEKRIDDAVVEHNQGIKRLDEELHELGEYTTGLAQASRKHYQKLGFVRFDPFGDASGSISFAVALLNADGDGLVISSLHGRDGNRVYAKEVTGGKSKSPLTDEEMEAIKQAA